MRHGDTNFQAWENLTPKKKKRHKRWENRETTINKAAGWKGHLPFPSCSPFFFRLLVVQLRHLFLTHDVFSVLPVSLPPKPNTPTNTPTLRKPGALFIFLIQDTFNSHLLVQPICPAPPATPSGQPRSSAVAFATSWYHRQTSQRHYHWACSVTIPTKGSFSSWQTKQNQKFPNWPQGS